MKESHTTEFKPSWRDDYLKWICAFANTDGGRLLFCRISNQQLAKYRERRLDNGSITKIVIDKTGNAEIEYENQTDHISQKV